MDTWKNDNKDRYIGSMLLICIGCLVLNFKESSIIERVTRAEQNRNIMWASTGAGARSVGRDGARQRDENRENRKEGAGARTTGQVDELGER